MFSTVRPATTFSPCATTSAATSHTVATAAQTSPTSTPRASPTLAASTTRQTEPAKTCAVAEQPPAQTAARETRWQRMLRPHSYWPGRYTRVAPLWHPWHVGAFLARLRIRYLGWR